MTSRSRQRKLESVKAINEPEVVRLEAATPEQVAAMTHLTAKAVLTDGREITLIVPAAFGPAELETCIGMLLEVRKAVEAQKQGPSSGIIAVQRPPLVRGDGRPVS